MDKIHTQGEINLKRMGNAIGEPKWYVKEAEIFIDSMLSRLKSSFCKFRTLPFSARGGNDEQLEQIEEGIPQKLSEYCFLGPIVMAFDALKQQEQEQEKEKEQETKKVNFSTYPHPNSQASQQEKETRATQLKNIFSNVLQANPENPSQELQKFRLLERRNNISRQEQNWVIKNSFNEKQQEEIRSLLGRN